MQKLHIMLKTSFIFTLLLLLAACGTNKVKDEGSPFYAVPVGSVLTLHKTLTIGGGQVAIYVQRGEVLQERNVDKYRPNCKFEIYAMSEQPRSVQKDNFEIVKVVDEIETASIQSGIRLAALGPVASMALDASEVFNFATLLYLNSEQQKDVYRLTCQHWDMVVDGQHLSIEEMRSAMGDVFTLKIKE